LLGNRLAVLSEGRVRQVGSPAAVTANPEHRAVAGILGVPPMNLVHGAWAKHGSSLRFAAADGILLPMPAELVTHGAEGQPVTVGIRPEDIFLGNSAVSARLQNASVTLTGWRVRLIEPLRGRGLATAALGRWLWSFWQPESAVLRVGDAVSLRFSLDQCYWFGPSGNRLLAKADPAT
jgi:ABC-type sugar transport system ATPase subunit